MSDIKSQYNKILQDFIKGSILVKVKAKQLYKLFAEWLHGKNYTPFEDLPFKEQKAWVFAAHKIPVSVEGEDDEGEEEE